MITNTSIGRYGRFGNQMFQIAAAIGIARASGQDFAFPEWINHDHKDRFGSSEDVHLQKYFENPLPALSIDARLWPERPVSWGYHDIYLPSGDWNLSGHFQSEKYFDHCIDEVRHYFRMIENEPLKSSDWFEERVAIHVRRGDYDDKYHTLLGLDYYKKAISKWPEFTDFVVFSDDMNAAREILGIADNIKYSGESDYIQDFSFMKHFGGFICANSSFSLMAAILSEAPDKKIVCPSQWFGPAWTPDTKDLYPKNAIVI